MALRQHSKKVAVNLLTVGRSAMPAEGEARPITRSIRKGRRRRAVCSIFATVWLRKLPAYRCPARFTYTAVGL